MADAGPALKKKKKTKLFDLEIDGVKQTVWVRQLWTYKWQAKSGMPAWDAKQKKTFHAQIEAAIRKTWSGKFVLEATGTSSFAKAMAGKTLTVYFDVDSVTSGAHYTVIANKIPVGTWSGSKVSPSKMVITIDTEDMKPEKKKGSAKGDKQTVASHEFGHAIKAAGWSDEYKAGHVNKADVRSIMNVGSKVRKRHGAHICAELSKMIPNTTFTVKSVK